MSNLRALCRQCNLKKGNSMPSPLEFENMKHFSDHFPNAKNVVRTCQIGAYNCFFENVVVLKKDSCSMSMATGSGKSDVVRLIALGVTSTKKFAGVWAFSPSIHLRDQLKNDMVQEFFDRCNYPTNGVSPFISVASLDQPCFRNNCVLESYTTQFLTTNGNVGLFLKRAQLHYRDTGLLPVAVFDESHLFSTDNEWGKAACELQKAGIPIVLITGTPYRSDSLRIPGFKMKELDSFSRAFVNTKKDSTNPLLYHIERGNAKVCRYELAADYEYSYQRAWEDNVILKPSPHFVDALEATSEQIVSEMPLCEVNRLLRVFLMDERTITSCVEDTVKAIRLRKNTDNRCAALVTTLSDEDGEGSNFGDIHATRVEREFKRQAPDLRILVVTSNNNADDGLYRFEKKGYDVLIVKAMGTIGYNCPRIKTVLHLSNYRTLPAFVQLANRGCRCFAENADYDIIMPKDKGMIALWYQFKESTKLIIEEKTVIDSTTNKLEIPPKDTDSSYDPAHFTDHEISFEPDQKRASADERIEQFNLAFPDVAARFRPQEKLVFFSTLSMASGEDILQKIINNKKVFTPTVLLDCNEEEDRLRGEANDLVKEMVTEILHITSKNMKDDYGTVVRDVWTRIKRDCGFRPNQTLEHLCGLDNFKKIIESGKNLKMELFKKNHDFDYERFLRIKPKRNRL